MSPEGAPGRRGVTGRPYSTLAVGEELAGELTITETHVVLAASIFNDPGPNHVNVVHAERGRFGARIAHGPLLLGIADGALGNALGGTIVALLEQSARFRHPAFLGDTVIARWVVVNRTDKPSFGGGGVVAFDGELRNQEERLLVDLHATLGIAEAPP